MALNIRTAPSSAPGTSLTYITIGALLAIWSAVWYFGWSPQNPWATICVGLFLTGLTFLAIGFGVGQSELLVVPKQVAPAVGRVEAAKARAARRQVGEIIVGRGAAAEAVDQQRHRDPAVDGPQKRLLHPFTGVAGKIDIIEQPKRLLCPFD